MREGSGVPTCVMVADNEGVPDQWDQTDAAVAAACQIEHQAVRGCNHATRPCLLHVKQRRKSMKQLAKWIYPTFKSLLVVPTELREKKQPRHFAVACRRPWNNVQSTKATCNIY